MSTLKQRLQDELIGKDVATDGAFSTDTAKILQGLLDLQRTRVDVIASHIAADVEGLIPARANHEYWCHLIRDMGLKPEDIGEFEERTSCDCGMGDYNRALTNIKAALARYMKARERRSI